jgi:hypothetical protein
LRHVKFQPANHMWQQCPLFSCPGAAGSSSASIRLSLPPTAQSPNSNCLQYTQSPPFLKKPASEAQGCISPIRLRRSRFLDVNLTLRHEHMKFE